MELLERELMRTGTKIFTRKVLERKIMRTGTGTYENWEQELEIMRKGISNSHKFPFQKAFR